MPRVLAKKIMGVAGIVLLVLTMANSVAHFNTIASRNKSIYDRSFIAVMNNISALVPPGSVIVVSTFAPHLAYFTGHIAKVPWGVSSKASLVEYMKKNQYDYLLVFEKNSEVPELSSLFNPRHVRDLETNFLLMGSFQTDFFQIDLYKLRDSG